MLKVYFYYTSVTAIYYNALETCWQYNYAVLLNTQNVSQTNEAKLSHSRYKSSVSCAPGDSIDIRQLNRFRYL